mgnify:CR=1 FL=1|jgi:hypothetical protein
MLFPHALLRDPVEVAEIRLPGNSDGATEKRPVLEGKKREAERGHGRPQLARVHTADRDRLRDALPCLRQRRSRKQSLHAKEVCVEHGREADLVDDDLRGKREEARRVVEVIREPHEPVEVDLLAHCIQSINPQHRNPYHS